MPLFKRTTSIDLFINRLNFRLPPDGNFERLEQLILSGRGFVMNPSVFLHRCPRLRKLEMEMGPCPWETKIPLTVESKSLEEVTWNIWCSEQVAVQIVTPELKKFKLKSVGYNAVTVTLSAPKLEEFYLEYGCRDSRVGSGETWHLIHLQLEMMKEWRSKHGQGQQTWT